MQQLYLVGYEGTLDPKGEMGNTKTMCIASTAKRRRKQAANHYRHLSKLRRPKYKRTSAETSARRLQRTITKLKELAARKGRKK